MANRVLTPVTELDFDGIKQNLKNYLSTSTDFTDFDYEGSGMNILLDLLAYNTHYTAMYANMLAAESFLDSAVLRKSIVSLAKNLGYIPNSRNAARATVNLTFGITSGVPTSVPAGTNFTATKNGIDYVFTTTESYTIDKTAQPYKVNNMEIYQGQYRSLSFVYDPDSNSTKFEIPFSNIDKELIRVYVMNSPSDLSNADFSWKENSDYLNLDSTTKVYFINENYKGNYEVSFGDGIFGQTPVKGNYIVVVFFETEGADGNNIGNSDTTTSSFVFSGIGGSNYSSIVTTVSPSQGGAERDGNEKIRYTAPKYYQSQDRTVTISDYESIILKEYADANSVRVWGGEDNDPPEYGKVFVSILPKNSQILSDGQKKSLLQNVLNKKKIVTVNAEIVDPEYTYILINAFVTYTSAFALSSESSIRDAAKAAIYRYSDMSLQVFGSPFRYSVLSRQIDLSSNSIVSSRITTSLMKKIIPVTGKNNYILDFGTPLSHQADGVPSIVSSSLFYYRDSSNVQRLSYLEDNGYGKVHVYANIGTKKVLVKQNIGTIDYGSGKINLIGFSPTATTTDPFIKLIVVPDQKYDIVPQRNQILLIDSSISDSAIITTYDASARKI